MAKLSKIEKILLGVLIFLNFGIKFYIAAIMLFMVLMNELLILIKQKKIKDEK